MQITAVYASSLRRVKEPMFWGQTDSEVELNESMALHLLENFFSDVKCLSDVGRVDLRCGHLYALSGLFCKRSVLGLGFQSELFRRKEFPADLVESFLSHSSGLFLLEKLLDLIPRPRCHLATQLLELSLV